MELLNSTPRLTGSRATLGRDLTDTLLEHSADMVARYLSDQVNPGQVLQVTPGHSEVVA